MTREELGASLNLSETLIPRENANRPGTSLRPSRICVHNTDNTSRGADAVAHSRHLINNEGNSGYGPTSWHYTVDDIRVIKHLPLGERGMHAYASGNSVSIGIEMCMNSDGDWATTVDRSAKLVACVCYDFGWTTSAIKQHHDFPRSNGTRKNCPSRIRGNHSGIDWDDFVRKVEGYLNSITRAEGFSEGLFRNKLDVADATEIGILESSPDIELDVDHGEIIIPNELLNFEE